jgi:hypothetical protein
MVPETPPVILFGLGHIFALPQVNSSQLSSFRSGSGVPLSSGSGRSSQATESASNLVQADFPLSIEVSAICIFGGGFRNRAKKERKRSVAIVILGAGLFSSLECADLPHALLPKKVLHPSGKRVPGRGLSDRHSSLQH